MWGAIWVGEPEALRGVANLACRVREDKLASLEAEEVEDVATVVANRVTSRPSLPTCESDYDEAGRLVREGEHGAAWLSVRVVWCVRYDLRRTSQCKDATCQSQLPVHCTVYTDRQSIPVPRHSYSSAGELQPAASARVRETRDREKPRTDRTI